MVFYVAMVIFLMKLLMNEFTSFVMDDWNLDENHSLSDNTYKSMSIFFLRNDK